MTIDATRVAKSTVEMTLVGRLDTASAPLLERKIKQWGDEISEMILDFAELEYISSMGLRVLLQAQKAMKEKNRKLVIKNMGDSVREVFEITGFLNAMVQEEKFIVIRREEPEGIVLSFNGTMKIENMSAVLKELSDIKEQRSHQQINSDFILTQNLEEILEGDPDKTEPATVILDMGNLSALSAVACKHLKQAIDKTAWDKRTLVIRNASSEIQEVLAAEDLKKLLVL
jgi:anti-sigma B factor antagonist